MTSVILSIDCGTQSLRALLFSGEGILLDSARVAYDPCVSPKPGWAEQDPEIYWQSLVSACAELKERSGRYFKAISGIGVTSQRGSMINVDVRGNPLRPAIIWLDQRKALQAPGRNRLVSKALALAGLKRKLDMIRSEGKCNWLRQNQPGIWSSTEKYLQVSGFLNHRLTGIFADSVASQIGHIPFSYRKMRWASRYELPALLFPVEPSKLPELITPGAMIGTVTARASKQTGLCQGIPVIACGSDKGCETLGAGVVDSSMASLSFGTTATIQTTTSRYMEPIRMMPPYPAPVPGFYNPEVEIFRGFWMITWFKNQFAHEEALEAARLNVPTETILDRHLRQTPPGAMGLVVQPFWGPGLGHPFAKGAMIGFGGVHTKAHIYRAVIEGLGFALNSGREAIEKAGKLRIHRAAVSGGASQSNAICRIVADIFNLPMVKGRTHETSGLGAAIVTAMGLGAYRDIPDAVRNMVVVDRVFEPEPEAVSIYRRLYREVYQNLYASLEPFYRSIQSITGYPEL